MIRGFVDFALNNRILIVAFAVLLFIWGGISFHQLPVEAYPDVANNYVELITQWPGISAEQVEQQVTIPLEIVMNGIPHLTSLRSFSLFGLSDLKLTFDDGSEPSRPDLFFYPPQHQSEVRRDGAEIARRLGD